MIYPDEIYDEDDDDLEYYFCLVPDFYYYDDEYDALDPYDKEYDVP